MVVTITTDASFSRKNQIGTFAFWIVCSEFRIVRSGALLKKVTRPDEAEFKCIINALHVLFTTETKKRIQKIIINTDCLNVIHLVKNKKREIKIYKLKFGLHLVQKYQRLLQKHDILEMQVEFRHVKAHQHTDTKVNWVNQWCDDAAKMEISKILDKK